MPLQPKPFTDAQLALRAKITANIELRRRFSDLRLEASKLLSQAETVAYGLSEIEVQQVRAAGKLAGVNFYSLGGGQADAVDFQRLREDLEHVARSVDPLIEAIGNEARNNSITADKGEFEDCFSKVIENAITGNATHVLDTCGEAAREAIEDIDGDNAGDHQRKLAHAE